MKRIIINVEKAFKQITFFIKSISMITLLYKFLFFPSNEIEIITLANQAKKKKNSLWYSSNLLVPLLIIYIPYLFTKVSEDFGVIVFNKSLIDLTITGSFSLLGINVMRNSLTIINEKIDYSKLPESITKNFADDVESTKSRLRLWINALSWIGGFLYLLQVCSLLNSSNNKIYYYLFIIVLICLISVIIGRHITVVQTNFLDDKQFVSDSINKLKMNNKNEYNSLEASLQEGGL